MLGYIITTKEIFKGMNRRVNWRQTIGRIDTEVNWNIGDLFWFPCYAICFICYLLPDSSCNDASYKSKHITEQIFWKIIVASLCTCRPFQISNSVKFFQKKRTVIILNCIPRLCQNIILYIRLGKDQAKISCE